MSEENKDWTPPRELPDISRAPIIALDTETRDPNLLTMGPGAIREDGYIIGISAAVDGWSAYLPIRHEGGGNLHPENVLAWCRDMLKYSQPKCGANILYDLEWLRNDGVEVNGPKYDIQVAEPLIDENQLTYSLEALANRRLGESKDETALVAAMNALGYVKGKDIKGNMWRLHSKHVGPYGEKDASLPLRIFEAQRKDLDAQELWSVFNMETELIDLLLEMRYKGIPVDLDRAERTVKEFKRRQNELYSQLCKECGFELDIWSGKSIAQAADQLGLFYPLTAKGNPSFEADWLEAQEGVDFYNRLVKCRRLDRGGAVFIQSKILDIHVNGRIHPTIRQVRGDGKGTRSGRFAYELPNMQQVPARDPSIAKPIRSIFIPEPGCEWGVLDWSQQEPRVTVHYAYLRGFKGADIARQRYIENPRTDYHQMTADLVYELAGLKIDRSLVAKPMNLGLAYGMGKKKMASSLGFNDTRQAEPIFRAYHKALPYISELGDDCAEVARDRGYIRTISGRRRHFDRFGPRGWKPGISPLPYEQAVEEWGPTVVRYFVHKALNALVQGTSADMMKIAMLKSWKETGNVPHISIHDELDVSIESRAQLKRIHEVMINCLKLEVPLVIDTDVGPSWGEAKKVNIEEI